MRPSYGFAAAAGGTLMSLKRMAADERRSRARTIVRRDEKGRQPVFGSDEKMHTDAHFKDHLLFSESFDGENGRGRGASPQTGRSGLVAKMSTELPAEVYQVDCRRGLHMRAVSVSLRTVRVAQGGSTCRQQNGMKS
jgi:hypothetical protein